MLDNMQYFGETFAHDFIRNFYHTDVVPSVKIAKNLINAKTFTLKSKDNRIFSPSLNKTLDYFTVPASGGSRLFVKINETQDNVTYSESTTLGVPYSLQEFNITDAEGKLLEKSVFQINNSGKSSHQPGLPRIYELTQEEIVQDQEDAKKRCINIK